MTLPEIEALLEGAYFPDNETREAVVARVSEAIPQWLPMDNAPKDGTAVLIHYLNRGSKGRIIKAMYAAKYAVEANDEDELDHEYCEEKDQYYAPEGWYEIVDNWDDFSYIKLEPCHVPNAWQPLPKGPAND